MCVYWKVHQKLFRNECRLKNDREAHGNIDYNEKNNNNDEKECQAYKELGLLMLLVGVAVLTFASLVYFAEKVLAS